MWSRVVLHYSELYMNLLLQQKIQIDCYLLDALLFCVVMLEVESMDYCLQQGFPIFF
jgi:hypothetical protein